MIQPMPAFARSRAFRATRKSHPAPNEVAQEFAFTTEESDDKAARAELLRLQARGLARQAVMDPKDGLEL